MPPIYLTSTATNNPNSATTFCSQYQAVIDRAVALGRALPPISEQVSVNAFVKGIVDDGIYTEADLIYILKSTQSGISRINVKSTTLYDATPVSSPTFVSGSGWTSGGAGYLDTAWLPLSNSSKLTQNSASIHIGISSAPTTALQTLAGWRNSGTGNGTRVNNVSATQIAMQINGATTSNLTVTFAAKLYTVRRVASNDVRVDEDGVQVGSSALTSSALEDIALSILALNNSGTRLGFTNATIGLVVVGSNSISSASLTTRWNTLKAAF